LCSHFHCSMVGIFLLSLSGSSDFSFFAFLLTVCCLGQVQVFAQYACTVQLIRAPFSLICCLLLSYCFPCASRASSPSLSFLTRLLLLPAYRSSSRCRSLHTAAKFTDSETFQLTTRAFLRFSFSLY